jgi:hypothetical protein
MNPQADMRTRKPAAPIEPLPTVEQSHPWLWWAYAAAVAASAVLSALARACSAG